LRRVLERLDYFWIGKFPPVLGQGIFCLGNEFDGKRNRWRNVLGQLQSFENSSSLSEKGWLYQEKSSCCL
ncbi:MAG TPA: hypothetical protein PKA83_01170, partial [Pirellulaceae bacterium]|nr:hypothetical protein [Pirellulaceae bacterium]